MNLLLDTHVLLWWIDGSKRLGKRAKAAMVRPSASLWISAASVWELAIKLGAGRLKTNEPLEEIISSLLEIGFQALPISLPHALAIRALPAKHADPFDRILVAQAQCEDLTIVTTDPAIAAYDVRTIDASD